MLDDRFQVAIHFTDQFPRVDRLGEPLIDPQPPEGHARFLLIGAADGKQAQIAQGRVAADAGDGLRAVAPRHGHVQ